VPSVEQLNLGHLLAGLVAGTLVVIAAATLPRVRPYVPALMAAAVVVLGAPEVGVHLDGAFVAWLVVAAIVAGGALHQCARHASPAVALALLVMTIGGLWVGLPDTEVVLLLAGTVVPVTGAALATVRADPVGTAPWSAALLGATVIWVIGVSSGGRSEAALGAVACLGVLVVVPLLALAAARLWQVLDAGAPVATLALVLGAHAGAVLVCSRVAGRADDLAAAALVAGASLAGIAVAVVLAGLSVSRGRSTPAR
jgi:hypothetical protein